MDWSNEDYVRVYIRETPDDLDLSWQALALWRMLLTKFDRSGLIPVRKGWESIARLIRWPVEVVAEAGPELVTDGRIRVVDAGLFAPNFVAAQTATKSDKARQRESRDRRRAAAEAMNDVELPDSRHAVSHDVTTGSHAVTQSHSLLCDAMLCDTSLRVAFIPDETPAVACGSAAAEETSAPRAPRKKRGDKHRLPSDWSPSRTDANTRAEAEATARGVDLRVELSKLRDWASSNAAARADWDATWRNWTRNAKAPRQTGFANNTNPSQVALDELARIEREAMLRKEPPS